MLSATEMMSFDLRVSRWTTETDQETLQRISDQLDEVMRAPRQCGGASQSGLAPDCFTIGAQRWTSSRTKAANSAALLPTGMAPSFCNCSRMPGLVIAATIAALSLFVMSAGRWAGPKTPNHAVDSKPCTISPIAGKLGNDGCRCALVTP